METLHEAEQFLRNEKTENYLYVKIDNKRRRLFINPNGLIGIIAPYKKHSGYLFDDWSSIEKIYYPKDKEEQIRKLVTKYKKLASLATFESPYLEKVKKADINKSLYENQLTTGTSIDGKVISLKTIEKYCGEQIVNSFKDAIKNRENFHFYRFDFGGYDGSLWVNVFENGTINAGFSKEYRNCGNGYYYMLINDDNFIGYDID